jgi:hypothetical protein
MQEAAMSKHSSDPKFSPLIWLVPLPFVLAAFIPLTIDHPAPAKAQTIATASIDREPADAASSPRPSPTPSQR